MTVYHLKRRHEEKHPKSHYFSRETLKFFGERLSSMRVLKNTAEIKDSSGETHTCFILSKLSKNFSGKTFRNYDYFDVETLDHISPA